MRRKPLSTINFFAAGAALQLAARTMAYFVMFILVSCGQRVRGLFIWCIPVKGTWEAPTAHNGPRGNAASRPVFRCSRSKAMIDAIDSAKGRGMERAPLEVSNSAFTRPITMRERRCHACYAFVGLRNSGSIAFEKDNPVEG